METKIYTIDEISEIVTPIAKAYQVSKLYLFGSYARGEADAASDIDLRVDGGNLKTLFALGGFYADLEEALNKPLDIITTDSLRKNQHEITTRNLIKSMKNDEKLIYEEQK